MVIFGNLARITSLPVGFLLHVYFFKKTCPNLDFPLEYQIQLLLTYIPIIHK